MATNTPVTGSLLSSPVAVLRRTNSLSRVALGAFSDRRLQRLRSLLGPDVCTVLGPGGVAALRFGSLRRTAAMAAQVPVRQGPLVVTNEAFVVRAHRRGLAVHVWTIDDAAEMHRLLDIGVDGIMTDRPQVLKGVFEERGIWQ